ncbi:MAG TPA: magnesium transporter CorA family protein [Actinomycetes bacterium]|nr:magnesium transporter CorA family protein [Actinomycetes bacterium]
MATAWILREGSDEIVSATLDEAVAVLTNDRDTAWLDVTPEEFEPLAEKLDYHPQAVEDALKAARGLIEAAQRSKLDRFPGHLFLYLFRSCIVENNQLELREVPLFVGKRGIVSVDRAQAYDMSELVGRWRENPGVLKFGVPALLYGALDLIIDSHLDTVDGLADAVDSMEDDLFAGDANADPREVQLRSFATRKSLVRLRRVTQPMRELISAAMRRDDEDGPHIDPQLLPYYQDLYDHTLRINDTIEGLRDLITTIYETRLALFDHTLNTVTRQLAAWAAIIAVPTAVTGFYGQNIPYPGFAAHSGFWASTITWVSVSVILYVMFKRRKWL